MASDGGIFTFGDAPFEGSVTGSLSAPIAGMTTVPAPFQEVTSMVATPDDGGYFQADIGGDVYTYGDAQFNGSPGSGDIPDPVFGMAPTADGGGYWIVTSTGTVYPFGDATSFSGPSIPSGTQDVDGLVPTASGEGYWIYDALGDFYAYGDAQIYDVKS